MEEKGDISFFGYLSFFHSFINLQESILNLTQSFIYKTSKKRGGGYKN